MKRKIIGILLLFFILGFLMPQNLLMPVEGAGKSDYNSESFWYYPWGKSVTHKGVDIFANTGAKVKSSTLGLVLYSGTIDYGGKVVYVLGPKWRIHYYAHLDRNEAKTLEWVSQGEVIGAVGNTGNAAGKSPHLHYSITTPIPYPWRMDNSKQGWKKMFVLNPIYYLEED